MFCEKIWPVIDVYYLLDFQLGRMVVLVTAQAVCVGFVRFGGSLIEVKSWVMHSNEQGRIIGRELL